MPKYTVHAPDGRMVTLTGDAAPSESDLDEIFSQIGPRKPVSAEDFAPTTLPYKGQRVPGDTFADKLRNAASVLGGEALGGLKGAAHSALNIGQMAVDAGMVPGVTPSGFNPAMRTPVIQCAEADTAYGSDPAEQFGGQLEIAVELAAPALDVAKGGVALAKAVPKLIQNVSPLALDIATHLIPGGSTIRRGAKIDNLVQIGHASDVGENSLLCAQVGLAGSSKIGKNVILTGQVGVAGHLEIGDGVIATAQTGIPSSVEAGKVISGYPAIDNKTWLKSSAVFKRLPELLKRIEALEKKSSM